MACHAEFSGNLDVLLDVIGQAGIPAAAIEAKLRSGEAMAEMCRDIELREMQPVHLAVGIVFSRSAGSGDVHRRPRLAKALRDKLMTGGDPGPPDSSCRAEAETMPPGACRTGGDS